MSCGNTRNRPPATCPKRACPVPGCGIELAAPVLLCMRHWDMVDIETAEQYRNSKVALVTASRWEEFTKRHILTVWGQQAIREAMAAEAARNPAATAPPMPDLDPPDLDPNGRARAARIHAIAIEPDKDPATQLERIAALTDPVPAMAGPDLKHEASQ